MTHAVLKRLESVLGHGESKKRAAQALERMSAHPRSLQPALARSEDLVATFASRAEDHQTVIKRLNQDGLVEAIIDATRQHNLPGRLFVEPEKFLKKLDFTGTSLDIVHDKPGPKDLIGLSLGAAAIAETGTLVMHSGRDRMTTLNFVPEHHIVVLKASSIVGSLDDVWPLMRKRKVFPRAVNFITGPSRTGDIEQTLFLGAHGPRSHHILILDDA
jgi:Uncharacterized conserved protein